MKILWLSHLVPYPPKGGVLQRSFNLIKEVSKHHDVYLFAFNQPELLNSCFPDEKEPLELALEGLAPFTKRIHVTDIPSEIRKRGKELLAFKSLFSHEGYTVNWLKSNEAEKTLRQWRTEYDFDAVHYDTISLVPYRSMFAGIPSVLDHHNIESDMMLVRSQNEKNYLKRLYFLQEAKKLRFYEARNCPSFDLNITCSSKDTKRLESLCKGSIITEVPNGVDVDYFSPVETEKEANSLIFAGGLSWYPNIDAMRFFAYEIWPLLKEKIPDVKMHLVGRSAPSDLVELGKTDPRFQVHGFVDDVRPYLARASAYICPIRDGGGTKLKVLDALAMKCPLVAHPFACDGIDVTEGKDVIFAESPDDFVTKICSVLQDQECQRTLASNGRDLVESRYSFEQIGLKLAKALDSLKK